MAFQTVQYSLRTKGFSVVMAIIYTALAIWAYNALPKRYAPSQRVDPISQDQRPGRESRPPQALPSADPRPGEGTARLSSKPPAPPAPVPAQTVPPSANVPPTRIPVQTASTPPTQAGIANILEQFDLNGATIQVRRMIDGMIQNSDAMITEGQRQLQSLKRPTHGDRKLARADNALALEALRIGDNERAVRLLLDAARADPADVEIVNNLAYALHRTGTLDEAHKLAVISVALAPDRTAGWGEVATILADRGEHEQAVAAFRLEHRFSKNKEKLREAFAAMLDDKSHSLPVRNAVQQALEALTPPASAGTGNADEALLARFIRNAEACMQRQNYDCTIANARNALNIAPANSMVRELEQRAIIEQRRAMDAIQVR